jgi:hypothetical protein
LTIIQENEFKIVLEDLDIDKWTYIYATINNLICDQLGISSYLDNELKYFISEIMKEYLPSDLL